MAKEIIVSKLGTSLNADREVGIKQAEINNYIGKIVKNNPGFGHAFVVSGAREIGMYKADQLRDDGREGLPDKVLAGVGATALFAGYESAAEQIGFLSASYGVTAHQLRGYADSSTIEERLSLIQVIHDNIEQGVLTFLNEADGANDKELMRQVFDAEGEIDNDQLSSFFAIAVGAARLDIWKSGGGFKDERGLCVPEVNNGNYDEVHEMLEHRGGGKSGRGTPVITLEAMALASRAGISARMLGVNEDMTGVNVTRVMVG